jgi:hypothetical protein
MWRIHMHSLPIFWCVLVTFRLTARKYHQLEGHFLMPRDDKILTLNELLRSRQLFESLLDKSIRMEVIPKSIKLTREVTFTVGR